MPKQNRIEFAQYRISPIAATLFMEYFYIDKPYGFCKNLSIIDKPLAYCKSFPDELRQTDSFLFGKRQSMHEPIKETKNENP